VVVGRQPGTAPIGWIKIVDKSGRACYVQAKTTMTQHLTLRMAPKRQSTRVVPWQLEFAREIGPEELVLLHSVSKLPTNSKAPLAKLRAPHHTLAQMLANGDEVLVVSRVTGYAPARIRTLMADPAFDELISFYAEQKVHAEQDVAKSIAHVGMTATQILQERLEEEPESFSNKDLLALQTAQLDRSGHGPQSKKTVEISDPRNVLAEMRQLMAIENRAVVVSRDEPIDANYEEILNVEESPQTEESQIGQVR